MDKIFYHIYPLGFAGATEINDFLNDREYQFEAGLVTLSLWSNWGTILYKSF